MSPVRHATKCGACTACIHIAYLRCGTNSPVRGPGTEHSRHAAPAVHGVASPRDTYATHAPHRTSPALERHAKRNVQGGGRAGQFSGEKNRSRVLGPLVHFVIATDHFRAPESPGPFRARASPPAEPNPGDAPRTRRAPKQGTLQCLVRALLARTRAKNAKTPAFLQKTRRSLDALRPCSGKRI